MMDIAKSSVTIGIYAQNASSDILYLLRSILKQKGSSFSIKEIVVISDGSTDSTTEKVSKYSEKYPFIKLLKFDSKKGKIFRLHQIFEETDSDFLLVFDGDVILSKNNIVEKMIAILNSQRSVLVSVDTQPMPVKGLKANIIKSWIKFQHRSYSPVQNRNTILNFHNSAFGLTNSFAKRVIFPNILKNDSSFLYLVAKSQNLGFSYIADSTVLFHAPTSFKVYLDKKHSIEEERKSLLPIFGKEVRNEYKISFKNTLSSYLVSLLKNPFMIPIMIFFVFLPLTPYKHSQHTSNNPLRLQPAKRKIHSY